MSSTAAALAAGTSTTTTGTSQVTSNLINLDELNEPVVLYSLKRRFDENIIYTYLGSMLISVNPFKQMGELYSEEQLVLYQSQQQQSSLPPHLFAIANNAYQSVVNQQLSQAIIISGESGAGKTEATKILLKFITRVASATRHPDLSAAILATNPILEAFGNAKTVRNNNSSRFGKLVQINFEGNGDILGALLKHYLLESTRVVHQEPNERNYHIFYQLLKGAPQDQLNKWHLTKPINEYHYISNGDMEVTGIDDKREFETLLESFIVLGFQTGEIYEVFSVVAAVLHLGNITFTGHSGDDNTSIKNSEVLAYICDILKIPEKAMKSALEVRQLQSGGRSTIYTIPLTYDQAIENRDALAKLLYSRLFDYLVTRMNAFLSSSTNPTKPTTADIFITVLDIYGFEVFDKNSLEQFCINYANEKLHEQFNRHMFKAEQEEYLKEGIPWSNIKFVDNSGCIDLIEDTRNGILSLLDEECKLPKGTEKGLISKYSKAFLNNPFFSYTPLKPDLFGINHYAGTVHYEINNFMNKNRNNLNTAFVTALVSSHLSIIPKLFEESKSTTL